MKYIFLLCLLCSLFKAPGQVQPFRFAFISDTHIGSPNGLAEEDLRRTVADINAQENIDFVVLTGDITELGKEEELRLAKLLLDSLKIRYYILPGNHDTGWSGTGGLGFSQTFGDDKFHFIHKGMHFIGVASGPYVRMSDGHVPRHHINWLTAELGKITNNEPVVYLNHYPLDSGLDNWYEVIDLLKQKNTVLALCGHGHNNRAVKAEGIPAVMGRSNLRAKNAEGGYNLVQVTKDSFLFTERSPVSRNQKIWVGVANAKQQYTADNQYPRPDTSVNSKYPGVKELWRFHSPANVISTPSVIDGKVVFGNQNGTVQALNLLSGKKEWAYHTGGPIFSSPASTTNLVILGSADGTIYSFNKAGKKTWTHATKAAVLGSPVIENNVVYIGGSDSCFQALTANTGKVLWKYCKLEGPVTGAPLVYGETIIFGAWDRNLYALNKKTGALVWKWNNGSPVINYSPAACTPVVADGVVYVVAPDRYLSAIDAATGSTLWRTGESKVRESIGISENGKFVFGKTMQDSVVAFHTNRASAKPAWKFNVGFGYEHVPSMLIEKDGRQFFGTKNGVVYCLDGAGSKIHWVHKVDNSMVNTVRVLGSKKVLVSTMDGSVVLLEEQ